jgi:hypothetical protein
VPPTFGPIDFCPGCEIRIDACSVGQDHHLIQAIANETGCKVTAIIGYCFLTGPGPMKLLNPDDSYDTWPLLGNPPSK